jgi:hypothetical protein
MAHAPENETFIKPRPSGSGVRRPLPDGRGSLSRVSMQAAQSINHGLKSDLGRTKYGPNRDQSRTKTGLTRDMQNLS